MERSGISVVVISYNYGRFLRQAVESVLSQTRSAPVLIMDDASTDETSRVVAELIAAGRGRIAAHRQPVNLGLAETRNLAARLVTTPWLVYLDADDWLAPHYVERMETCLDADPGLAALTTDMFIVRGGRRPFRSHARVPRHWSGLLRRNTIVQTSCIRRDVVLALDGYDASLHFEDWDFWIRVLKAGYRIGRVPGPHVYRREHALNKSKTCDAREGIEQIRRKHGPSSFVSTAGAPQPFDVSRAGGPTRVVALQDVVDLLHVSHAPDTIDSYRSRMLAGDGFPPIAVVAVAGRFVVADGHKRLAAYKSLGHADIVVETWSGMRLLQDQWQQAVGNLRKNGRILRLSVTDPRAARDLLLTTVRHWRRVALALVTRGRVP
jgi:GT2 family glycosyltransferase